MCVCVCVCMYVCMYICVARFEVTVPIIFMQEKLLVGNIVNFRQKPVYIVFNKF